MIYVLLGYLCIGVGVFIRDLVDDPVLVIRRELGVFHYGLFLFLAMLITAVAWPKEIWDEYLDQLESIE